MTMRNSVPPLEYHPAPGWADGLVNMVGVERWRQAIAEMPDEDLLTMLREFLEARAAAARIPEA